MVGDKPRIMHASPMDSHDAERDFLPYSRMEWDFVSLFSNNRNARGTAIAGVLGIGRTVAAKRFCGGQAAPLLKLTPYHGWQSTA